MGFEENISKIFIAFIILKNTIELYLDLRNKKYIESHSLEVPKHFQESISLKDHQKAARYTIEKIKFSNILRFVNILILVIWTLGGGLNYLDQFVQSFEYNSKITGLLFFALFGFISAFIDLPSSIYSTFYLEEKFGFNKTTPKVFISDLIKNSILSLVIGLPILYGLLSIMSNLGSQWWIYAWVFLCLIQFALMWLYPTYIAPLFNKFEPLQEEETKNKILQLMERTGFKSNGLFIMDASKRSSHGNAYFTGFGKNKRIVFFDNLIQSLSPEEVEAVLAHELGHFKRKHILKGLIKSVILSLVVFYVLAKLIQSEIFFQAHGIQTPSTYMALCLFSIISGTYLFFLTPINAWSSRKWEFEADEFAHQYSNGKKLITALVKLYKENASTLTPDPLYSSYFHSHPPAMIRVNHLEELLVNSKKS